MGCLSTFFRLPLFVVIGTSNTRESAINAVRRYKEFSKTVIPISRSKRDIEGIPSLESLTALAHRIQCRSTTCDHDGANGNDESDHHGFLSHLRNVKVTEVGITLLTPPEVTVQVIEEALHLGFRHFFLQPGSLNDSVQHYVTAKCKLDHFSDVNFIEGNVHDELPHLLDTEESEANEVACGTA